MPMPGSGLGAPKVSILGGSGAVGSSLGRLLAADVESITCLDLSPPGPGSSASHILVDFTKPELPADAEDALRGADIVIVALPEDIARSALPRIGPKLADDALLADTLSVKQGFCDAVAAQHLRCEVLSINPMYAPTLEPRGRPVAWLEQRPGQRTAWLRGRFENWGSRLVAVRPDEHDRVTAMVQAATHALVICHGMVCAEELPDLRTALELATPPFHTVLALLARVASLSPESYWDIQRSNPQAAKARRALATAATDLDELVLSGEFEEFQDALAGLADWLEPVRDDLADDCASIFERLGHARTNSATS
jgi:4-amino-4-deoxyprephenate dehydrogenase